MFIEGTGGGGLSKDDDNRIIKKTGGRNGDNPAIFYSYDGGWNDPKFSTWNLLRQGSACTACHVTHDQPGDWGIPTNDELNLIQVQGWRSLDRYAIPVHMAGLSSINFYASQGTAAQESTTTLKHPDYVVSPNGDVVPIPDGATGPIPAQNGAGFRYTGGSGGSGLDPRVTDVRIMDPTPRYPNGYVSYSNASGQAVNPFTGQTVSRSSSWWHIILSGGE